MVREVAMKIVFLRLLFLNNNGGRGQYKGNNYKIINMRYKVNVAIDAKHFNNFILRDITENREVMLEGLKEQRKLKKKLHPENTKKWENLLKKLCPICSMPLNNSLTILKCVNKDSHDKPFLISNKRFIYIKEKLQNATNTK